MAYTCTNGRFTTDVLKGHQHKESGVKGSVFAEPLYDGEYGTVFLEHVKDSYHPDDDFYWIMSYDKAGKPTVNMSAVFEKAQLAKLIALLMHQIALKGLAL